LDELDRRERAVELVAVDLIGRFAVVLTVLHFFSCGCWRAGRATALPRDRLSGYSATVMPIDRAVPAMIFSACSMSLALRSAIFCAAIARSWARLIEPTFSLCGTPEPLGTPAALISSRAAGGVFRTNWNVRSS